VGVSFGGILVQEGYFLHQTGKVIIISGVSNAGFRSDSKIAKFEALLIR
jgi:hypothetical protein